MIFTNTATFFRITRYYQYVFWFFVLFVFGISVFGQGQGELASEVVLLQESSLEKNILEDNVGFDSNDEGVSVYNDGEFLRALWWMHDEGMTKYDDVEEFRPHDHVTREEGAKFLSIFAKNIVGKTLDTSIYCAFDDLEDADKSLQNSILESCMLHIFKGSMGRFFPKRNLTKAEAIAVLVRSFTGMMDESGSYRRRTYLEYARSHKLTKEFVVADLARPVTRYEIALLLWRAKDIVNVE